MARAVEVGIKNIPVRFYLKDHMQRIPRFVIRRYLEKSIQKKLFAIYIHYK